MSCRQDAPDDKGERFESLPTVWRRQQQPPGRTATNGEYSREVLAQLTKVIGNRAVNEIKGGLSSYRLDQAGVATWSHHWRAPDITAGGRGF